MRKWLLKPYPFLLGERQVRLKVCLFIFVFVVSFLSVFKPFNIEEVQHVTVYGASFLYGITSAGVALISVSLMVVFFPDWMNEKSWNIGREFVMMFSVLFLIAVANFILAFGFELHDTSNLTLLECAMYDISRTFSVGIFPIMVITFTNYTVMLRRNLTQAEQHNFILNDREPELIIEVPAEINLTSATKNNDIVLNVDSLLYIMADGNYVEFYLSTQDGVKREIKRNTLNNIADQLEAYHFIFRSHRAFMVNLNKVIETSGNAQGYQLKLEGSDQKIPVSRSNLRSFDDKMRANVEVVEQLQT